MRPEWTGPILLLHVILTFSPYTIVTCYFNFFSIDLKTSTPSSVLKKAAIAEYGFSSNGTLISFLLFDAQVNDLWSWDNFIILASVANIAKFLNWTFSSLDNSKNKTGFCLAKINASL